MCGNELSRSLRHRSIGGFEIRLDYVSSAHPKLFASSGKELEDLGKLLTRTILNLFVKIGNCLSAKSSFPKPENLVYRPLKIGPHITGFSTRRGLVWVFREAL